MRKYLYIIIVLLTLSSIMPIVNAEALPVTGRFFIVPERVMYGYLSFIIFVKVISHYILNSRINHIEEQQKNLLISIKLFIKQLKKNED